MSRIKIGWSKRSLSLDVPMSIPGQMHLRISEGIHDPLMVNVLCVDGGQGTVKDTAIFMTCAIGTMRAEVIRIMKEKIHAVRPEIPLDSMIIGATHTHAGGCVYDTPEETPDGVKIYPGSAYREFFAQQCADAVCEAWDTRAEGGISYGYGYAVVAHSRRVVYLDDVSLRKPNDVAPNGHAVMYGNTNDPMFSHYEAGADHFLNLMFTFDKNQKLTGIVINVPCPSQLSEHFTQQSSDYWNEVAEAVAKEFGEDVYILPQCAAAGDLSPRILHYKKAQARRMELKYGLKYDATQNFAYNKVMGERYDIAERILLGIRDVYSWAKKDIQTDVKVCHEALTMHLARRMVTAEEKVWCEENIERMRNNLPSADGDPVEYRKAVSRYESVKSRNEWAIERYESDEDPNFDMAAHVVRIGDVGFCTCRFELYMDFMHRVQARSPFVQTFVIELAGDVDGTYLATDRGRKNKGYSASLFCNRVGPEGGQQWVEESLRVLNSMAEE